MYRAIALTGGPRPDPPEGISILGVVVSIFLGWVVAFAATLITSV